MRTAAVAAVTGISFRRLDYLTRQPPLTDTHPDLNQGSGCHRWWPVDVVTRLVVAGQIIEALPELDLPHVASQILSGPNPPPSGWIVLRPASKPAAVYVAHPADLAGALIGRGASLVVPYDLRPLELYVASLREPDLGEGPLVPQEVGAP